MEATAKQTSPVQVAVDPKALTAAIRAVREFVCTDPTRYNLHVIHAEAAGSQLRLTATDGHSMCTVEVPCEANQPGTANLSDAVVEGLLAMAKGAKGLASMTTTLEHADGTTFPEYKRVQPPMLNGAPKGNRIVGLDGTYLARVGHVQKALKASGAVVQFGEDNTDAVRADVKGDLGEAVIVIMPRRV